MMIKILAIDDNKDNLVVLRALLTEAIPDSVLYTAESGKEGLNLIQEVSPDVVLLDLVMPVMDGYEVLKRIRQSNSRDYLPVIILTAAGADRKKRIKALELGADAFLSKPVDEAELTAQIRVMLRIKEMEQLKRFEAERLSELVEERTRELKEEMEERRREQKLLRTLIDNLPQTIYVKDINKRKILANRSDLNIVGKSETDVIGKTDLELYPLSLAQKYEADDDLVLSTEQPLIDREELIITSEGKRIWFLTSKLPLFDHTGKLTGIVGISHDITTRIQAENDLKEREISLKEQNEEYLRLNREYVLLNDELTATLERIQKMNYDLQLAKDRAEEGDRLKTAFLHNISHEIRTPLNSILGFSSIMGNHDMPLERRKEFVEIINKSSDQLLSIISSIMALASLETGQEGYDPKDTDINQLLLDVYEQHMVTPLPAEVSLSYHTGLPDEQALIETDAVKLMQILINLVGNALKFTIKGDVRFGYELKDNILQFYVEDTGIGISEDMHEIIFERFRQVDNSATRKYGGTGLGLALSKGYAELLGGNISVHSAPGMGSKFILHLPYKPVDKSYKNILKMELPKLEITDSKTILVAEDETNNFILLKEILTDQCVNVCRAENGLEAMNICLSDVSPDLVLMDIKMPVMNGIEATIAIKKIRPQLPIIAVTAYTSESDKRKFFDAGCDDYLEKPIRQHILFHLLSKHLKL